jgi:hypothetical protein
MFNNVMLITGSVQISSKKFKYNHTAMMINLKKEE